MLKAVAAHYVMHAAERRSALHVRQREVVAELVAAYSRPTRSRLDPDLRRDWDDAAPTTPRALRVVVDQVAVTDRRAGARTCTGGGAARRAT